MPDWESEWIRSLSKNSLGFYNLDLDTKTATARAYAFGYSFMLYS